MREQRVSLLLHPLLFCSNIKTRIQNVSALRARCSALQTHPLVHASDGSLWLSRTVVPRQHQPIRAGQTDVHLAGSEGLNEDLDGSRAVLVGPQAPAVASTSASSAASSPGPPELLSAAALIRATI